MNKTINVFPLILVFIFNIALFISTPYNKNILNIFPLSDIIWSFIYFIVVFLLFNYYIRCSFVNFTNYKKLSLIFCALLSIRIIFDFTYYFFKNATTKNIYALFIDFIFDLIFVYIIFKANTNKNIFLNENETYNNGTNELEHVDIKDKINQLYKILFVKEYSNMNLKNLGKLEFNEFIIKEMNKAASFMSMYADYKRNN